MDAERDRRDGEGAGGSAGVSVVALDRVTLAMGGETVLADVSLAIEDGEFIGLLGPNGSGKTTLLRAVLGLVRATSGTVSVFGRPARRGNPAIGYLPQTRSAPAGLRLTGRDFLASAIDGHRWGPPISTAADAREIDRVLAAVDAETLARRPLDEMSGGQRQRLLLAQALIGKPKLLLLDEPLISLDPHQQRLAVDLVRRLSRELKLTVLFSGHELNQLLPAIDRVLYLGNRGAALGTVDQVVTPQIMSRLYGAPIEVVRVEGRIFIMSEGDDVEYDAHRHNHGHDHGHEQGDHAQL
jgi:zinc/manganese transport system ATP-binding protein